jgi:hypothetical protein
MFLHFFLIPPRYDQRAPTMPQFSSNLLQTDLKWFKRTICFPSKNPPALNTAWCRPKNGRADNFLKRDPARLELLVLGEVGEFCPLRHPAQSALSGQKNPCSQAGHDTCLSQDAGILSRATARCSKHHSDRQQKPERSNEKMELGIFSATAEFWCVPFFRTCASVLPQSNVDIYLYIYLYII